MLQLKQVLTQADWSNFIDLPWKIYKDDPHWVAPLKIAVKDQLNIKKHPFFKHAEILPLAVYQGNECVGRMVGIIDQDHNTHHHEMTAFFGFFETIDDERVVELLLSEVTRWAKSKGMGVLRGPMSPSTNYECGLLVEGFSDPPTVMTTYNPSYYPALLEKCGFTKTKDLYAYLIDSKRSKFSSRLIAQSERLKSRNSVRFRSLRMKDFDQEIERILEVYNDAWEDNWGFVPMRPEEFRHMAKDMKSIADPDLCLIAEVRGEVAGFALTLPDINQVLKKVPTGKLFPFGIFKLLWNLKGPGRKKTINRCRIITLGIKKAYREYGIGPLLYTEYLKRGPALGYPSGEASWILEDNKSMNRAIQLMSGERSKVYRIYDLQI